MAQRWGTGRTEAFSDGVFAIAITLLVLDLAIPPSGFSDLWRAIADEWPGYLAYVTSFVTIGGFWMAHHSIFRRLDYANAAVMRANLVLLMAVAFLPFPTRLMAQAIHSKDAERAAVVFYGVSLLVIALLFWALWRAVARDRELLKPGVSDREVEAIRAATTPNIGFYVLATALAIVTPRAAASLYLVIAIVAVLRARGDQTSIARPGRASDVS